MWRLYLSQQYFNEGGNTKKENKKGTTDNSRHQVYPSDLRSELPPDAIHKLPKKTTHPAQGDSFEPPGGHNWGYQLVADEPKQNSNSQ